MDVPGALRRAIEQAAALREHLGLPSHDTDVYRLLNSEGDGISGTDRTPYTLNICASACMHVLARCLLQLREQAVGQACACRSLHTFASLRTWRNSSSHGQQCALARARVCGCVRGTVHMLSLCRSTAWHRAIVDTGGMAPQDSTDWCKHLSTPSSEHPDLWSGAQLLMKRLPSCQLRTQQAASCKREPCVVCDQGSCIQG